MRECLGMKYPDDFIPYSLHTFKAQSDSSLKRGIVSGLEEGGGKT